MRRLIVTRGLPGSGKSHTLSKLGLMDYTLSADAIRLLHSSPVLTPYGKMTINPSQDGSVWKQIFELTEARMKRGDTLCVDATHPSAGDFKKYLEFAKRYRYEVACLDFSDVPVDVSDWHNEGREEYRQVPQFAVDRITKSMRDGEVPESVNRVMVRSNGSHLKEMQEWLRVPLMDLSDYERVVHIGDIQGCYTAAKELLSEGFRNDTFYIFVGDACDRGDENGEVMRWLIDDVMDRQNVAFMWGNHEDHLHLEALGEKPVSGEFIQFTLPDLKRHGVTREELDSFCSKLHDILLYRHGKQDVLVTHAGLSNVPEHPWKIPASQCAKGTGYYEDDVDSQFERHAPKGWAQVHGHRNSRNRPTQATERSFNLEASVEDGGHLRGLVLDKEGFKPFEVRNRVFRPFRQRRHNKMTFLPHWIEQTDASTVYMDAELHAAMVAHEGVREKSSESFPHVLSMNFTKDVFFEGAWDNIVCKARGLFLNGRTLEIVSRSYEKFFNINEREDTTMEVLKDRLVFPFTGYLKENGYLGIIGYDSETDQLFVSSKSTPDGPFSAWFRDILEDAMPNIEQREALKRFLRNTESSMAFEVIDPVNDPHMVDYPEAKLVLLDVIHRSTEFDKLPYDDLQKVGKKFGFEVKQRGLTFKDWKSFEGWHKAASKDMSKQIEGYVFEDANGYQVKWKAPFYTFWKRMRTMKDAIVRESERQERIGEQASKDQKAVNFRGRLNGIGQKMMAEGLPDECVELAFSFRDWCLEQDPKELKESIIDLRTAYDSREPALSSAPSV